MTTSEVESLISSGPERLPLSQGDFRAPTDAYRVRLQDSAMLFPGARHDKAALAGLLLRLGCWADSHSKAQDISSIEGSYWHGIVHRMEPDSFNAEYWFRRLGEHPIFPQLLCKAAEILEVGGPKHWRPKSSWDSVLFVKWCDEARERGGQAETAAVEIQMAEWRLLFDWCVARGYGQGT